MERQDEPIVHGRMRRFNPTVIALVVLVALIGLLIAYASTRDTDQDKLKDAQLTQTNAPDLGKRCSSTATYDMIKRSLFQHAAQLRQSDQEAFSQVAAEANLRMENPVMESQDKASGAINCSGSLSLDLPPSVAVQSGQRTLMSDVDYTVQPAADGSGDVVIVRNADAIITPLSTLSQTAEPDASEIADNPDAQDELNGPQAVPDDQPQIQQVAPSPTQVAPTTPCSSPFNRRATSIPPTTDTAAPRWEIIAGMPSRGRPRWILPSRPFIGPSTEPR